jgi:hypothetical protein
MLTNLPYQWQHIWIYHCSFNELYIKQQLRGLLDKGSVKLFNLETSPATKFLWAKLQGKEKVRAITIIMLKHYVLCPLSILHCYCCTAALH